MKRLGYCIVVLLVPFVLVAQQARAQEPIMFHGLYGGFYSGYVDVEESWSDNVFGSQDFDLDGWINGLTAGYNHKHDRFLIGVEVDGGIIQAHDDVFGCAAAGFRCGIDLNWLVTARGRLGYLFGEQQQYALFFTGGVAVLGYEVTGSTSGGKKFEKTGFVIGGGAEGYLFDTAWLSTKVEYLYVDFSGGTDTYPLGSVDTASFDLDALHIVRVGLNIHF